MSQLSDQRSMDPSIHRWINSDRQIDGSMIIHGWMDGYCAAACVQTTPRDRRRQNWPDRANAGARRRGPGLKFHTFQTFENGQGVSALTSQLSRLTSRTSHVVRPGYRRQCTRNFYRRRMPSHGHGGGHGWFTAGISTGLCG